jgi:DnaJ-class molecular chaperone
MKKCKLCSGKGQRMRKGGYLKSHVEECDRCKGTGFVDEYLRKPYPQTGYSNRYNKNEDMEKLKDVEEV